MLPLSLRTIRSLILSPQKSARSRFQTNPPPFPGTDHIELSLLLFTHPRHSIPACKEFYRDCGCDALWLYFADEAHIAINQELQQIISLESAISKEALTFS